MDNGLEMVMKMDNDVVLIGPDHLLKQTLKVIKTVYLLILLITLKVICLHTHEMLTPWLESVFIIYN